MTSGLTDDRSPACPIFASDIKNKRMPPHYHSNSIVLPRRGRRVPNGLRLVQTSSRSRPALAGMTNQGSVSMALLLCWPRLRLFRTWPPTFSLTATKHSTPSHSPARSVPPPGCHHFTPPCRTCFQPPSMVPSTIFNKTLEPFPHTTCERYITTQITQSGANVWILPRQIDRETFRQS